MPILHEPILLSGELIAPYDIALDVIQLPLIEFIVEPRAPIPFVFSTFPNPLPPLLAEPPCGDTDVMPAIGIWFILYVLFIGLILPEPLLLPLPFDIFDAVGDSEYNFCMIAIRSLRRIELFFCYFR